MRSSIYKLGTSVLPKWEQTIQVQRPVAGTYVNGRYVDGGSPTIFDIDAVVIPTTPESLDEASQGRRTDEMISVWTRTQLNTVEAPHIPGTQSDNIVYEGETYQVNNESDRNTHGNYRKYFCAKVGQ